MGGVKRCGSTVPAVRGAEQLSLPQCVPLASAAGRCVAAGVSGAHAGSGGAECAPLGHLSSARAETVSQVSGQRASRWQAKCVAYQHAASAGLNKKDAFLVSLDSSDSRAPGVIVLRREWLGARTRPACSQRLAELTSKYWRQSAPSSTCAALAGLNSQRLTLL